VNPIIFKVGFYFKTISIKAKQAMDSPSNLDQKSINAAKISKREKIFEALFFRVSQVSAIFVLAVLLGIFISLLINAWPSLQHFGINFFFTSDWNINKNKFGALIGIYGTVVSSFIALLIATPLSFGIALFLTEICPIFLRRPLGIAVELLAAIPSIIYGMFGLFIFSPIFADYIEPSIHGTLGHIPLLSILFSGGGNGIGVLCAGLILAMMILPFITAVMRDVFLVVPPVLKESAYGMGCTTWEVSRHIVLPYTKNGLIGGIMLGLGRALGETMAVTFVIGNAQRIQPSLFAPGSSIASTLANQFGEATPGLHLSSLFALGLTLFIITLTVLSLAKLMLVRMQKNEGANT
jgi:phosphate transport system permease protein